MQRVGRATNCKSKRVEHFLARMAGNHNNPTDTNVSAGMYLQLCICISIVSVAASVLISLAVSVAISTALSATVSVSVSLAMPAHASCGLIMTKCAVAYNGRQLFTYGGVSS